MTAKKTKKAPPKKAAKKTTTKAPAKRAKVQKPMEEKKRGRKPTGQPQRANALFLRMRPAAQEAIEEHLAKLNEDRRAHGLPKLAKASWAHDALLESIGRSDLTVAGMTAKAAELAKVGE